MAILFITGNKGKFDEVKSRIPTLEQLDIDLVEIQSNKSESVIESKLRQAQQEQLGQSLLVEDTSLYCNGLGGLPGPLIKWFQKSLSIQDIAKIVLSTNNNTARAVSMFGYIDQQGKIKYYSGQVSGKIVEPRGSNGFGWDAIFQPTGSVKTFAEMQDDEKNSSQYNMRKLALDQLVSDLKL